MFNLGASEILVILIFALVLLGPRRLAIGAAALGKTVRDLRRAGNEFRENLEASLETHDQDPSGSPKP